MDKRSDTIHAPRDKNIEVSKQNSDILKSSKNPGEQLMLEMLPINSKDVSSLSKPGDLFYIDAVHLLSVLFGKSGTCFNLIYYIGNYLYLVSQRGLDTTTKWDLTSWVTTVGLS